MKSPGEIKKPGLYVVRWLDILSDPSWSTRPVGEAQPATCVTCGWLIWSDGRKIILADSRAKDGDWGGLTVIPSGVIVKQTRLSARSPESFMREAQGGP